jgi:TolA-binding protein
LAQEPKPRARPVPEELNFANGLLHDRRYDLAVEEYERFLKRPDALAQDAADARFGLATSRLFLGQAAEARRQFEAFLKAAPDHPNAGTGWFRVGESAYMIGDLPAAREALERFTRDYPKHRQLETAWPYLGDVAFRLGDQAAARRAYQQALDQFPQGRLAERARYGLARTLAAQGERDEALHVFAELAEKGSREWAEKARYQIGVVESAAGRDEKAAAAFEDLERRAPQSSLLPEARLRRAEVLVRLDRREEAEALLRPLATSDSGLAPQAALTLGESRNHREQAAEAMAIWQDALKRFPTSALAPALEFRTAEALAAQERTEDALNRFLTVANTYPNDAWAGDALLRAAELSLKRKDTIGARKLANRYASTFPKNPLVSDAHLVAAQAAVAEGKVKEAIPILTHLLDEEAPSPATARNARISLSVAYRQDGQPQKAAEVLEDVAKTPDGPGGADALYLIAQGHFEAKRYAEAVPALERYLASNEKLGLADHALALLALSRLRTGDTDGAWDALGRLEKLSPDSKTLASTRVALGESALEDGHFDRAAETLRRASEEGDGPALRLRALSGLGWALLKGKKPAEAAEAFGTLLAQAPDDPLAPEAALGRARALEDAGQDNRALTAYDEVRMRYPKSERAEAAVLARARLLERTGRPADAAAAYEQLLRDHREGVAEGPPDRLLAEWGWALIEAGKAVEADQVFGRLLEEHPDSPRAAEARVNLAESAYKARQLDQVEQLLNPLVQDGSKADSDALQLALFRLGRVRFDRQDWPAAMKLFERLETDFAEGAYRRKAQFWKAESALQGGDPKSAEAVLSRLLAAPKPAEREDWLPTARLRRLQSLVLLKRWDEALAEVEGIKTELPTVATLAEFDFARGRALLGKGRFDEARAAFRAVIDARKGDELAANAQLMRGEAYFHQKQWRDALKEFLRVDYEYAAPGPRAAALLEAGKVYEGLDQWTQAAEIYEKIRSKFPNDPSAIEATKRLEAARRQAAAQLER